MAIAANPQTSVYETVVDDPDLEARLEERDGLKVKSRGASKRFREADDQVKALLGGLDLGADAPVRIGRFVVTRKDVAGRSVSFETESGSRISIKTVAE